MKRNAVIVISLLAIVGLVTAVSGSIRKGHTMQVRFNKRDYPKHDIHIITSADPDFEVTASAYFKTRPDKSGEDVLKPFSIFIRNSGNRTVAAYMLVWQLVQTNGKVITSRTSYSEPAILMGEPMPTDPRFKHTQAIEPNAVRCFWWSAPIDAEGQGRIGNLQGPQQGQPQKSDNSIETAKRSQLTSELAQTTDLTVSLDGVFFDDGSFVGPNTTGFFETMQAIVNAKLDLLRDVAAAKEEGKEDEVFESITAKSLAPDPVLTSEATPEDHYKYYRKLFALEISGMKSAHGKEKLVSYLVNLNKRSHPVLRKEIAEER